MGDEITVGFGGNRMNNGKITRLVLRAGTRAAAGIAMVAAGPALAVTTIDQANYVTGTDTASIDGVVYQTFTAGLSGSLAEIYLQISKASTTSLSVNIYKARGFDTRTELYDDAIGTGTFVRDAFGLLTYSTNASVLAGQYYGVAVNLVDRTKTASWSINRNRYDRGNGGYGSGDNASFDFGFYTVVDLDVEPLPSAVPEPAIWGMMILGMGTVGFVMRRRRITTRVPSVV